MSLSFSIYLLIILAAFIIGVVRFKKLTIPFKYLTLLVGLSFASEGFSRILIHLIRSSMPVYHIICIVHFVLLSIIYHYLINNPRLKKLILFLILPYVVFAVCNTLFYEHFLTEFPSNSILVSQAICIVYSLLLFRQMLLNPLLANLSQQSIFWFNLAVLIFFSVIIFNLGMINYVNSHLIDPGLLNNIIYIISIVFYSLFGIALLLDRSPTTK